MIRGQLWELIDDEQLRRIEDAAFCLLTKKGARVQHEGMLRQLEAAGCKAETGTQHCYFSEKLLRDALEHFGGEPQLQVELPGNWTPQRRMGTGGSYPHFLEWPAGERRLATKQDITDIAKMAQVLDEFTGVGQTLTCAEVDARIEPIWNIVARMPLTDKPLGGGEVMHAENVRYLVELGEIYSGTPGDARFVASCNFSVAPLVFGRRCIECMIEKTKYKVPHVPGTMPVSGLSAPVTIAGTVAVCVAELVGGWAMCYLLDPDRPASAIVSSGSLDMRTSRACFGSPEAHLQDVATVQLCKRLYGINISAALGYVDCKYPGLEAVFEKMLLLVAAPFMGGYGCGASGLLCAGEAYSPVQQLLELDIATAAGRFASSFDVTDETLALDIFDEVGIGTGQTFLNTLHTARNYQSQQWYPEWFDRHIWQGDDVERKSERQMLEAIDAKWKSAVVRWEPPDVDEDKLKAMQEVLEKAEREMANVELAV